MASRKEISNNKRHLIIRIRIRNYFRHFLYFSCLIFVYFNIINFHNVDARKNFVYKEINNGYLETLFAQEVKSEFPKVEKQKYLGFEVLDTGYDIFYPNGSGYRYGPSIMKHEDGSVDAWFASPGNGRSEWDWIRYRHMSSDGDWTKEEIVLRPTPNSLDHYSVCDPDVFYYDGYYYMGYTSTIDERLGGINNQIFVARSLNPNGPYEKWNGEDWGGDPYPIIEFYPQDDCWGAGEISFVVKDDYLYCYYTWDDLEGNTTRVSSAKLSDNWPADLQYKGISLYKMSGQDSCDVVYMEDIDKFVAVASVERMTSSSGVGVFVSENGYNFENTCIHQRDIKSFIHNIGVSKDELGHSKIDEEMILGYAYSPTYSKSWGKWATRLQTIRFDYFESDEQGE